MPFLGSLFNCSSNDSNIENKNDDEINKKIKEGSMERKFMKEQLEELKKDIEKISVKALTVFGIETDIAVMKRDLSYITENMKDLKEELKDLKNYIRNNNNKI